MNLYASECPGCHRALIESDWSASETSFDEGGRMLATLGIVALLWRAPIYAIGYLWEWIDDAFRDIWKPTRRRV